MPKWDKKTVYHSHIAREGRLMVKLKGRPFESKFKKGTYVVYFQVADDETEYALNIEPGTEDAFHNAPIDQWIMLHATGALKDDEKHVRFTDGAGPIMPGTADEYTPPEGIPADAPPPPPMWPEDEPKPSNGHVAPANGNGSDAVMRRCWGDAVALVRADFPTASPDAAVEAASRVANTLYIQASRG